ncbi:surface protease GP63, putative [Trypanosoma cruzi marinkellei]|uniref:Leishmanolysin-like peptidase n=1 Tax=Trypanosoma cruzi marinkellei TaxID=85056 RepID=K2LZS2_TRYCR|nr:surface protease GP63, putative [Trypanosoma cruzi marinkellei]
MFCDANDNETLRCTSDRRHVGTCTATIIEDKGILENKDVCPVVSSYLYETSSGKKYNTCSDGNVEHPPGSLTGSGSWCLDAESLEKNDDHKSVKGVCAQVLCEGGTVKVKYRDGDGFQPCHEGAEISVTLNGFKKGGKISCPKYSEVCTIAANGSSLVIPSALEDNKGEEQEKQLEASVVAPTLFPAASSAEKPPTGEPLAEEPRSEAPSTKEPHTETSSTDLPHPEASPPGVEAAPQQPQQESKAEQMTTVEASATTQQVAANSSQGSVGRAAGSDSHAVGGATGDGGTVCGSELLPLLLLLGLWGLAAQ